MKVYVLIGVDLEEGIPQDTICGIFATKELMMEYRTDKDVDEDYAYVEYAEYPVIVKVSPNFTRLGEPIEPNPYDEFVNTIKEYK